MRGGKLVGYCHLGGEVGDFGGYGVEGLFAGFAHGFEGCLAVDGVYHDLWWGEELDDVNPGVDVIVAHVVVVRAVLVGPADEHGLYCERLAETVAEGEDVVDGLAQGECGGGSVEHLHGCFEAGVYFEDGLVGHA